MRLPSRARFASTRASMRSYGPQLFGYTASAPSNASSIELTARNEPPEAAACEAADARHGSMSR